jgi:hypothetical protein
MQLPALPEGYFWRLSSDGFGFMKVAIREKRRLGSRSVEYSMVLEDPPVESAVLSAAERALKKWNERSMRFDFLQEFRTLEGDYK